MMNPNSGVELAMKSVTARVLLIDADVDQLSRSATLLERAGYRVECASAGSVGLARIASFTPHAVVINVPLPDIGGIELAQEVRQTQPCAMCVLVFDGGTFDMAVNAVDIGVTDLGSKDLCQEQFVALVHRAVDRYPCLDPRGAAIPNSQTLHALRRWAVMVTRVTTLRDDPRTEEAWARGVAASKGAIRNWCRAVGLQARRSLLFARVLRALVVGGRNLMPPEDALDVVDRRTLQGIISLAGGTSGRLPATLDEFLARQKFIDEQRAIDEVRSLLPAAIAAVYPARKHRDGAIGWGSKDGETRRADHHTPGAERL